LEKNAAYVYADIALAFVSLEITDLSLWKLGNKKCFGLRKLGAKI
jgi:hypothetical protein